jgi:hypothetical protein
LRHPDRGAMLPSLRDTWGGVFILPLPRRRRRMEVGDEKTVLLLGAMLAALTAASGVAWAAYIQCPNDPQGNTGTC